MIKVLIADDHQMFVDGIASILKAESDISVEAKCFDGLAVFGILETQEINVILLDVNLPGMSGIEVAKKIKKEHKKVKVLALSMYNEHSIVTEIIKNGALGYILKNTGRSELLTAIRTIADDESYFSQAVATTIMNGLTKRKQKKSKNGVLFPKISRREKEVLAYIVAGDTSQEIAEKMYISYKTVESHRSSLLSKLDVRNTAGLVRIAIENKLIG